MNAFEAWHIDSQLAHGAWVDFSVLHGDWSKFNFSSNCRVEIYHSKDDPNAPYESIQALGDELNNVRWHITPQADHIVLAKSDSPEIIANIFMDVANEEAK